MLFETKMSNMSNGQSSSTHKTVAWRPSPTGLDRQASYPVAKLSLNTDHVGAVSGEIVWFLSLDLDGNFVPIRMRGKFGKGSDEPFNGAASYLIVRSF